MTAVTMTMQQAIGRRWWRVVTVGLIGAMVGIYLSLVGIITTFHQQQLITGVITIGQAFLVLTGIFVGYAAARRAGGSRWQMVAAGALAGLITGVGLALLVLLGPAINLRTIFLQASPALWNILTLGTFDQGPQSALVPIVGGLVLGAGAGVVATLPPSVQRAFGAAIASVLILSVLAGFVRNPLLASPIGQLRDLGRSLFAAQGLQVYGAIVTLAAALGFGIGAWLGERFDSRRGGSVGGVLGGFLLALIGGSFVGIPGAIVGGAVGIVVGAVAGAMAERSLRRADAGERFAALPPTQRRIALAPVAALVVLIILTLPYAAGSVYAATVVLVALYLLMGLGLNITLGLAGLLDLGFVAFFAVGAYTVGLMTSLGEFGLLNLPTFEVLGVTVGPFWFAVPFAVLFAFIFGTFLGLPVLGIRGDYLAIATLGFGEIVSILARSNVLIEFIGGPQGVTLIPKPFIVEPTHPLAGPTQVYYLALVAGLFVAFVAFRLRDSRLGRAWVAIREDEDVAEALGINLVQTKLLAYALGAAFAGLGGALFAAHYGAVFPSSINLFVSINVAALIIVGGMGSIPGVVVGALFLIGLPELLRDVGGTEYRFLFYGVALIAMMRFRPEGLVPSRVIRRELHVEEENVGPDDSTVGEHIGAPEGAVYPPDVRQSPAKQPTDQEVELVGSPDAAPRWQMREEENIDPGDGTSGPYWDKQRRRGPRGRQ